MALGFTVLLCAILLIASGTQYLIQKDIFEKDVEKGKQPFYINVVVSYPRDDNLMWRKIAMWASFAYYTVKVAAEICATCGKCLSDKKGPDCKSLSHNLVLVILIGGLISWENLRRTNRTCIKHSICTIGVGLIMLVSY